MLNVFRLIALELSVYSRHSNFFKKMCRPMCILYFSVLGSTPANLRAVARNSGVSLSFDPVAGAVSYNVSVTPVANIDAAALHVEASLSPLIFKECSGFIPGLINGRGIASHVCSCTVLFCIYAVLLALLCRVRIQSAGLAGVWANRSILRSCSCNTRFDNFGPFLNRVLEVTCGVHAI